MDWRVIDLLYVSWNRLEMTRESFQSILDNTSWEFVQRLYIADDVSKDGTREWLEEAAKAIECEVTFSRRKFQGPVAAMNWYLTSSWDRYELGIIDRFAKIDNDMVVCPGWLDEMLHLMTFNTDVDVFGMEPMLGPATMPPFKERSAREARHIGGKGLIRHRIFECCQPTARGLQGWTQWQLKHPEVKKAWVTPDLPCFGLDQLDFEPWKSLTDLYQESGWQSRRWSAYPQDFSAYWSWWIPKHL